MSAVASAITAICLSVNPSYNTACEKALDAGTRQIGIREQADQTETKALTYTEKRVKSALTSSQQRLVYSSLVGYRIYRDRKISIRLPTFGICHSLTNDIALETYSLNFGWRF